MESWPNEPVDTAKALHEWNTRAAQAAQPTTPMSGNVEPVCPESSKLIAERKPLSDAEIDGLANKHGDYTDRHAYIFNEDGRFSVQSFARAIEAAHKIG